MVYLLCILYIIVNSMPNNIYRLLVGYGNICMSSGAEYMCDTACWPMFLLSCICWGSVSNRFPQACCADPRVLPARDPGTDTLWSVVCSSTPIISMVLAVIDISSLIHVYLIASGPTVLRCGGR